MSIDWLQDLERAIDNGREIFACPGVGRNQWVIGKPVDELLKLAKRAADSKKLPQQVVRLISRHDTAAGDMYLVPVQIDEPGARNEPNIKWNVVETKEAAEMMRDVKHGPCPFFGMQVQQTVNNETA
jgi:hypothetical protein